MSQDSVSCTVDAVVYYHVFDAKNAVMNVQDVKLSTIMKAQATLRLEILY